ncbi:MAG: hypothetical protein J5727_06785 [Kiritimatiellae bacterium]|nr:hypothetical protein [Kiritimatiellia bacterium]
MTPTEIQLAVRDHLAADDTLNAAGIAVLAMDDGDLEPKIGKAHALGGKGIVAIVSAPSFRPTSSAAKNAVGRLALRVAVSETPSLNRRRPGMMTGPDAAWHVAYLLNQFPVGGPGGPLLVLSGEISPVMDQDGRTCVTSAPFECINQLK